jgi:2,3-bisphosphoglycerate-independent phosphoglycerate mutase
MKQQNKIHTPTVLLILDGFGLADPSIDGNAITPKTAPNLFRYMKKYPSSTLKAHGRAVGLFKDQPGNSEAGHLNIGAGRLIKQDLVEVSDSIKDGTFKKNQVFLDGIAHAKEFNSSVHVMGLLTDSESGHAKFEHMVAIIKLIREKKCKHVFIHLFTDGRDSPPHSAVKYLERLRKVLNSYERIATVVGRFYAMDRNKSWERTELAYDLLVGGKAPFTSESAEQAISSAYSRDETDEHISPTVLTEKGKPIATISDNDVVCFFNVRSDRARQLTKALTQAKFSKDNPGSFKRKRRLKNLKFVAMSEFGPDLPDVQTAFPSKDVDDGLVQTIGEKYSQFYISESEKYAHVTYFLNGGHAEPVNGEQRSTIPSFPSTSCAAQPCMRAPELTEKILDLINKGAEMIGVNFPNADMLGHTGDFEATKKGIAILDKSVKKVVDAVLKKNGQVLITADHGNAEVMIDPESKSVLTGHTTNPVPCILIKKDTKGIKLKKGKLTDVAPTLLKMLDIPKPKSMTGRALF